MPLGMPLVVKLKNGAQARSDIVNETVKALHALVHRDPIACYQLLLYCRKPDTHKMWPNHIKTLQAFELVQEDGTVDELIRNVVLSALGGESFRTMRLSSPFDPEWVKNYNPSAG